MALPCEELARARKSGWGSEQSKLSGYAIWSVAGSGATPSRIPHTTREQFIAFIAQHMKTASIRWAEFDAKIAHLGIERVDSQDFGIIERDPEAVYTGAFVKFSAFDPMLVVGGTTVLNRYLVTVALYGAYNGHSSMQSALAQVKKSISASLEVDGAIVALLKGDQESWRTAIPQLRTVAITALIESVPPNNPPTSPLQVVACINALIAGQPVKGISETISREFIVGSVIHLVSACTAAQQ